MDLLNAHDLIGLASGSGDHRISIFVPTHRRGPQTVRNRIRLKNLLRHADHALRDDGLTTAQIDALLKPARQLLDLTHLWDRPGDGLALSDAERMIQAVPHARGSIGAVRAHQVRKLSAAPQNLVERLRHRAIAGFRHKRIERAAKPSVLFGRRLHQHVVPRRRDKLVPLPVVAAAQGRRQFADLLHEPHERALDPAAPVLGVVGVAATRTCYFSSSFRNCSASASFF